MPNRIVNFQMQQPGEMANPQVVGVQQQNRLSLAERLRKYGLADQSGAQSFADSFNQQSQDGMRQAQATPTPMSPQQQKAGQIMKGYNAPGGGSEMGWKPSAPMSAQRGMMGSMSRGAGAISRGASSLGKGAASLGSSAMGAMRSFQEIVMADNQFINFNSQDVADMYRRNQYARMLQEQAATPIERASYKGIEAPLHPVQGAAKIASALLAGYQQNQMDERYANEKAAAEQKLVAEQERRRAEVADYQKGFEPTLSYGPSGGAGDYGTPPTISTAKSRGEILAHALRGAGSDNPQVANMGRMQYEQQNAMAQDEARAAERAQTREDMLSGRAQAQQNYEGTQAQAQRIGDRAYGLQLEKLRQEKTAAPKPLTEYQGKSLGFGLRAEDANSNLEKVGTGYSQLAIDAARKVEDVPGVGTGAYALLSPESKQALQAQRNFINAVLRQESGAAIAPSEFTNAQKQYFPQPGDDKETLKQKSDNRKRAISNFKTSAGPSVEGEFGRAAPMSDADILKQYPKR